MATAILTGAGLFAGPGHDGEALARPADDVLGPIIPPLAPPPGVIVMQPETPEAASDTDISTATRMVLFFAAVWLVASVRIQTQEGRWRIAFMQGEPRGTRSRTASTRQPAAAGRAGGRSF